MYKLLSTQIKIYMSYESKLKGTDYTINILRITKNTNYLKLRRSLRNIYIRTIC